MKTYFPPTSKATQPHILPLLAKPPNRGSILCQSKTWQSLHSASQFVTIYTPFQGENFHLFENFFSLEVCYFSPSLKLGYKSIVWICHTPCSICLRFSQTLSVLSWLQNYKPLHILYWFLGIHSFTLAGSQHMSSLSYALYTFKQCFI